MDKENKRFKLLVGNEVTYYDTLEECHAEAAWYLDWWLNDMGGCGIPFETVIDQTTGEIVYTDRH